MTFRKEEPRAIELGLSRSPAGCERPAGQTQADRITRVGWALLAGIVSFIAGTVAGVAFCEWAVRRHYNRATKAEVALAQCGHDLAMERSWLGIRGKGKR